MLDTAEPLDPFARQLATYIADTLHVGVDLAAWGGSKALPVFLTHRYRFYSTKIVGRPVLFMAADTEIDASPIDIGKHIALVEPAFPGVVVYAADAMNATVRSRLIGQGVAFVVPKNQLYLPQLAMDLRDHYRAPLKKRGAHFTPAAQMVLFHYILHGDLAEMTPTMLAEPLDFAAMSIGRAFDQLVTFNLATVEWRGRQKTLRFNSDRRTLLEISRTLLRTPVRGRHGVKFHGALPPMLRAGETALADLSDLAPPQRPTYAILATGWNAYFKHHRIEDVIEIEDADAFIETWRYDPASLSDRDTVDPLSLYAEYWDDTDERVAQAARAALEHIQW